VDYYDQRELPVPTLAALDELVGRELPESTLSLLPPGRGSERPHRLLVRVDFRTDVDLAQLAFRRGSTVMAMSFLCGMDNRNTSIGPPTVYRRAIRCTDINIRTRNISRARIPWSTTSSLTLSVAKM
jgi:hypothetical protein